MLAQTSPTQMTRCLQFQAEATRCLSFIALSILYLFQVERPSREAREPHRHPTCTPTLSQT